LISDMAGSRSTVGLSGGTGIPGPILSIAKEMSVLPFFKNFKKDDMSISLFLSNYLMELCLLSMMRMERLFQIA